MEESEEQWIVFKESIAAKSAIPMPKLSTPPKKQGGAASPGTTPNYALMSPVKAENTISVAALKFEFSLVTSAIKGGHKDGHTVQRGKLVRGFNVYSIILRACTMAFTMTELVLIKEKYCG